MLRYRGPREPTAQVVLSFLSEGCGEDQAVKVGGYDESRIHGV